MTYSLTPDVISANKPLVSKQNSASIVELFQAIININQCQCCPLLYIINV